ncbi:unnamed protein product [Clavelina lepadiformis]|uniref:Large ribosomal subunit protein mL51 n=1 Tax=Clavelina lepadiformis TaxID=159417 RepID=A0ABP0FKB2_CLALP
MLHIRVTSYLSRILAPTYGKVSSFSTTTQLHDKYDFRRKWITPKKWVKLKSGKETIPWLNSLPFRKNTDEWTKEKSYFGMYDFLPYLGNDVTIEHKMFCRGPGYVRTHNEMELKRLIRKRRSLGYRMHIEDLHTLNKRIDYLMKVENHRKAKTHG